MGNYLPSPVTSLLDLTMGSFVGPAIFLFYTGTGKSTYYGEEQKIFVSCVGILGYFKILFIMQSFKRTEKCEEVGHKNLFKYHHQL